MTSAAARTLLTLTLALAAPGVAAAQAIDAPLGDAPPAAAPARPAPPAPGSPGAVAREFYDAFCAGDMATLERLYAPDVRFRDEIFAFDDRAGTMGMWRKIIDPSKGRFSAELLRVEGDTAVVRWVADYRLLGRPIHNVITARLQVRDGRVVDHVDAFSWSAWSRQAFPLGPISTWPPAARFLKGAIRLALRVTPAPAAPPAPGLEDRVRQAGGGR